LSGGIPQRASATHPPTAAMVDFTALIVGCTAATRLATLFHPGSLVDSLYGPRDADPSPWEKKTRVILRIGSNVYGNTTKKTVGDLGGDMPDVELFGANGEASAQGKKGKKRQDDATFKEYDLDNWDSWKNDQGVFYPTQPHEYLSLFHHKRDPVCMSMISVKELDGTEYHITGDTMASCGWDHYPSTGVVLVDEQPVASKCLWLGGKKPELSFPNKMQFHLPSFRPEYIGSVDRYIEDPRLLCNSEPRAFKYKGEGHDLLTLIFKYPLTWPDSDAPNATAAGEPPTALDPDTLFNAKKWLWSETAVHYKYGNVYKKPEEWWHMNYTVSGQELLFGQTRQSSPLPSEYLVEYNANADPALVRPWDHLPEGIFKPQGDTWSRGAPHSLLADAGAGDLGEEEEDIAADSAVGKVQPRELSRQHKLAQFAAQWTHWTDPREEYSAVQNCQQDGVIGPDIANSHERKYCRLEDQKVFAYCETDQDNDCFNFEAGQVRPAGSVKLRSLSEGDEHDTRTRIDQEVREVRLSARSKASRSRISRRTRSSS
jgi:hypothetical protein